MVPVGEFTACKSELATRLAGSITSSEPVHMLAEIFKLDVHHEKTDLKVFVVVIPKEGWARMAASILLLVC